MNIIIIGAGSVGFITAEYFVREGHNVTVIDKMGIRAQKIQEILDVSVIEGQGTDMSVLKQANIENTDLFIALTEIDEVNILSCNLAKHAKVPRKIARLNEPFHLEPENAKVLKELGVDEIIDTEKSLIEEIIKDLTNPGTTAINNFIENKYSIGIFSFNKNSIHKGKRLGDIEFPFKVIPLGYTKLDKFKPFNEEIIINEFTYVYYGFESKNLKKLHKILFPEYKKIKKIMIYGSGYKSRDTSIRLSQALKKQRITNIEIITDEEKTAQYLSRKSNLPIILEDPSKPLFAKSESLRHKDGFIAISNNFEKNLFTCLVAHQKNVPYTIALARYPEHVNFISTIPLTSFINPALVTANKIMKFHKIDTIASRTILNFEQVECLELLVNKNTAISKKKIKDLPFEKSKVVAIFRHEEFIEPTPNTTIKNKDKILLLILEEEKHLIEKLI